MEGVPVSRRNARVRAAALSYIVDHGTDGPAALARRWLEVQSDAPGVTYRQVVEPGPLAGLRIDQRQADAAAELARLWRTALPGRVRPSGYGCRSHGGPVLTDAEERLAGQAARDYQVALDRVQWDAGLRAVWAVEAAVIRREAVDHRHLVAGLTALADHFQAHG